MGVSEPIAVAGARAEPDTGPERILEPGRLAIRQVIAPIALLGVGAVALILALVVIAAGSQNRLEITNARQLASSALRVESEQISHFTRDYAFWNDAAQNLTVALDEAWAQDNVGAWANESLGMQASLVIDSGLRLIFGTLDGAIQGADFPARFSAELGMLLHEARARVGIPGVNPGVVTSVMELDGAPVLAAAAAIKWEDDRAVPQQDGRVVVLVFVRRIGDSMLRRLGELYLLPGLRLVSPSEDLPDSVPLTAIGGRDVARLAWTGRRPGSSLVRELALPLAGIAVLAVVLMVVIVARARRSTQDLARSHEQLAAQTRALKSSTSALQGALAEAARANAAKSDFLARMSHELRTPLNAILGFSEIIAMELYGPNSDPRYRDYGKMIHESGDHLRSLINDILDLAKIESGRVELVEEPTSLDPIAEQCLGLLGPKIEAKRLKVSFLPSHVWLTADTRAVKQILLNLLSNAVKFTGDGGEIAVRVSDGSDGVTLTVSDTGCGMSRADLEQVFQMFGQARINIARDAEGSGLGLNIAKGLAEMHGGTLKIESEVGLGTTAQVWFDPSRRHAGSALAIAG